MDDVAVRVDPGEMVLLNGVITGRLELAIGEHAFPAMHWNDFVVVVLGWWCNTLARGSSGSFVFMDGPFEVRMAPVGARLRVELIDGSARDDVITVAQVSARQLRESLISAAVATLLACEHRGWDTNETRRLRRNLQAMGAD